MRMMAGRQAGGLPSATAVRERPPTSQGGPGEQAWTGGGDSRTLRRAFRHADRRSKVRALSLVLPMLVFQCVFFVVPIGYMLHFGVSNPGFHEGLPNFARLLASDRAPVPSEPVFAALAQDLADARTHREHGKALKPLRHQDVDTWRLFNSALGDLPEAPPPSYKAWFLASSDEWSNPDLWSLVRRVAQPYTAYYLLNALDAQQTPSGEIVRKPPEQRIYLRVIGNTFEISFWVTVATLLLGYPLAHLIATARESVAGILLVLLLLSFWTSLLVRTYAWLMLLQTKGVVNTVLLKLGIIAEPIALIHNRTGVYIAMIHILLPFMILPIYSVMKGIRPDHMRAAASLGATPFKAFVTVYLPQSLPGVWAGCVLVFIFSLGFYITPALVGGAGDAMISMLIAHNVNQVLNWGMASALGTLLLVMTIVTFVVYGWIVGRQRAGMI